MKNYLKIALLALFATFTLAEKANAGLLLEPYLGYVFSGKSKQTTESNYSGTEFGARIGYTMMGFAVGAEYAGTSLKDDATPANDLTSGDIGLFVAYKFPVLVRGYVTYIPSPEMKSSSSLGSGTAKSGNILKLGVGYTGLPFVHLNFELISGTYSKIDSFDLSPSLTTTAYALSVSAPFDLF